MKRKKITLSILLFITFTLIAMFTLWIGKAVFDFDYENLVYQSVLIGGITTIVQLVILNCYQKRK